MQCKLVFSFGCTGKNFVEGSSDRPPPKSATVEYPFYYDSELSRGYFKRVIPYSL
jgi:hypothetical protein